VIVDTIIARGRNLGDADITTSVFIVIGAGSLGGVVHNSRSFGAIRISTSSVALRRVRATRRSSRKHGAAEEGVSDLGTERRAHNLGCPAALVWWSRPSAGLGRRVGSGSRTQEQKKTYRRGDSFSHTPASPCRRLHLPPRAPTGPFCWFVSWSERSSCRRASRSFCTRHCAARVGLRRWAGPCPGSSRTSWASWRSPAAH
jgi:hypothetical protein